jgi:hypothetical protein
MDYFIILIHYGYDSYWYRMNIMFHRVFPMKLKNRLNEGEDAAEMIYQLCRCAKVEHWFHQPVDRDIYIYVFLPPKIGFFQQQNMGYSSIIYQIYDKTRVHTQVSVVSCMFATASYGVAPLSLDCLYHGNPRLKKWWFGGTPFWGTSMMFNENLPRNLHT